jgi:hypothetical protein
MTPVCGQKPVQHVVDAHGPKQMAVVIHYWNSHRIVGRKMGGDILI